MIYHDYCLFSNLCAHTPRLPITESPNPVPIPLALELRRCVCFPLVVAWRVNKRIHQSNARKRTQKWQYERGGGGWRRGRSRLWERECVTQTRNRNRHRNPFPNTNPSPNSNPKRPQSEPQKAYSICMWGTSFSLRRNEWNFCRIFIGHYPEELNASEMKWNKTEKNEKRKMNRTKAKREGKTKWMYVQW